MSFRRRVVVTGLGLVTPLGASTLSTWRALTAGRVAVRLSPSLGVPVAEVPLAPTSDPDVVPFDLASWSKPAAIETAAIPNGSHWPKHVAFGVAAATQAVHDAGLEPLAPQRRHRAGVAFGTGIGSLEETTETYATLQARGARRVSPYFVPRICANMTAGLIGIMHGFEGPNLCHVTACSSGANAIADAYRLIVDHAVDLMVAGASESCICPLTVAGFSQMKALSSAFNATAPEKASRPFDRLRDGFVLGEGGGALVLESLEHAQDRGARIYAELVGYGHSCDANHIAHPHEDGTGALQAMKHALVYAGHWPPTGVQYINAHATSTPLGDRAESAAIERLFGAHSRQLAVSSIKGSIGHLLGAAGAVEAAVTVLAIAHGSVPPTANLEQPGDGCHLDYVQQATARPLVIERALSNSFGFGGTNTSLLFSRSA